MMQFVWVTLGDGGRGLYLFYRTLAKMNNLSPEWERVTFVNLIKRSKRPRLKSGDKELQFAVSRVNLVRMARKMWLAVCGEWGLEC